MPDVCNILKGTVSQGSNRGLLLKASSMTTTISHDRYHNHEHYHRHKHNYGDRIDRVMRVWGIAGVVDVIDARPELSVACPLFVTHDL